MIRELLGPNTDTERQDGQAGEAVSTARSYFVRTDIKIVFNVHVTSRIHLLVAAAFKMCILTWLSDSNDKRQPNLRHANEDF